MKIKITTETQAWPPTISVQEARIDASGSIRRLYLTAFNDIEQVSIEGLLRDSRTSYEMSATLSGCPIYIIECFTDLEIVN